MTVFKGTVMRSTAILGIILMGLGIASLTYFASPLRLLFESPMGLPPVKLMPTILGALVLVAGIALSFGVRPRANRDKREP
jgi:hypothetical protein